MDTLAPLSIDLLSSAIFPHVVKMLEIDDPFLADFTLEFSHPSLTRELTYEDREGLGVDVELTIRRLRPELGRLVYCVTATYSGTHRDSTPYVTVNVKLRHGLVH